MRQLVQCGMLWAVGLGVGVIGLAIGMLITGSIWDADVIRFTLFATSVTVPVGWLIYQA